MITLEPIIGKWYAEQRGLRIVRKYDSRPTEFEVQAALYSGLKSAGVQVRGEFTIRGHVKECGAKPSRKRSDRYQCRFDLVIFEDDEPAHILEVKRSKRQHKTSVEDTRQARMYTSFGVPVTFIYGMEDANEFLRQYDK